MSEQNSEDKAKSPVGGEPGQLKVKKADQSGRKADDKGKKKEPISASKIFATVIIALITIALVGTSVIYVILPQINQKNKLSFGSYNGEEILYEANSTLYNQYVSLAQQYPEQASSSDLGTQYQLWNQAYQNAVVLTAIEQIAKASGVRAPQALVDKAILDSGYYNGEDGKFSEAKYNSTDNNTKASLNFSYKKQVPFSIIVSDEATSATSAGEQEFVAAMASATRMFDYIAVDYKAIPDDVASQYLEADPVKFRNMTLSCITTTSEADINEAYEALESGTPWEDAVAKHSVDSYASMKGYIGKVFYYDLSSVYTPQQLEQIFSTPKTKYTAAIESSGLYRIFKVEEPAAAADFSDEMVKAAVKNYMLENESELVSSIISEVAAKVAAEAHEDFDEAADANGLDIVSIGATPCNAGGSSYMGSFSYTDSRGLLSAAVTDELYKTLYTEETGYVTDAIPSGKSFIVVKITSTEPDLTQGQTVNLFYSYYGGQMVANDFYSNILNSDKHVNNFFSQFLNIFGSSLAQ